MKSSEQKEIEKQLLSLLCKAICRFEFEFKPFWTVTRCDWSKGGSQSVRDSKVELLAQDFF